MTAAGLVIAVDALEDDGVIRLLEEHLADMRATSPPESIHALDAGALRSPDITFWCARENGEAIGCIALKRLSAGAGEVKSMRTSARHRGRGVAAQLLAHLLGEARARGYSKLSLETGSMDFFAPARTLYEKFGFHYCEPFADYCDDPNSVFMELTLRALP